MQQKWEKYSEHQDSLRQDYIQIHLQEVEEPWAIAWEERLPQTRRRNSVPLIDGRQRGEQGLKEGRGNWDKAVLRMRLLYKGLREYEDGKRSTQ